jgi:CheY-like chemotaxis protein
MIYKSVLLVDDDDDSNFISEIIIKKSSIADSIACVKNGNEALKFIKNYISILPNNTNLKYEQVIFLDLHMPVMDGFDFLEKLNSDFPKYADMFKIYILTSSSNPADIERTEQFRIEGYINKPLDMTKLKIAMENKT